MSDIEPTAAPAPDLVLSGSGTVTTNPTVTPETGPTATGDQPSVPGTPASPPVTPAPTAVPSTPVVFTDPMAPLIPTTTFHDTREIAAAEALGMSTPNGVVLSPASREVLRGLETSLKGIESWIAYARKTLKSLPENT